MARSLVCWISRLAAVLALLGATVSAVEASVAPPIRGAGANFDSQAYAEGARDAPALLTQAGVACTVEQAVFEGEASLLNATGKTVGHARLYEVACSEGLGYLINVRGKAAPIALDCVGAGQTGHVACMLPLNGHPAGGLDPYLRASGVSCEAVRARRIGEDAGAKLRRYEVSCGEHGYVLDIPLADGSGPAPKAVPCLEDEAECVLTTQVQNVMTLAFRVGKTIGADCRIADARYVGFVAARGHQLYEVSCQPGHDGELIEVDATGAVKGSQDCSKIKLVGAACQLKAGEAVDPRIASAEQVGARPPPPPGAKPTIITNPDWIRHPSGNQVEAVYPQDAIRHHVSAHVVLLCEVAATGLMDGCEVIDESPVGFGFGAAALKMSRYFQMRPQMRDGVPVSGARVNIPINFAIAR